MTDRTRFARAAAGTALLGTLTAAGAPTELEITIENARNARGMLLVCATAQAPHFPDCSNDPAAVSARVPAATAVIKLVLPGPGAYAVSVIHDENGNGKLDTFLGIPREGFGFSRNPGLRAGPPSFASVRMAVGQGLTRTTIRLRYLL